jgi:1,4-dihydroxy-2-naphthoate octaprenyltransferase
MTTPSQWWHGARPRTLPAAISPVLVGTSAAVAAGGANLARALLALGVALSLQIGVNYANDYSDGVRGTDADRVGPLRLVGSGVAPPATVRAAAIAFLALAAVLGLVLVTVSQSWWLLVVGATALAAAWGYTGGSRPYGYRALGEASVFLFFGLVAVMGTTYTQIGTVTLASLAGGVAMGCLASAILVTNNLRDRPRDAAAGKRTLAVVLGDTWTRRIFLLLLATALAAGALVAVSDYPRALLSWLSLPWLLRAIAPVEAGATGAALVPVLRDTATAQLVFAVGLSAGLVLS